MKKIPKTQLVLSVGDVDNDGRADVTATLTVMGISLPSATFNLDLATCIHVLRAGFSGAGDAARLSSVLLPNGRTL